MVTEIRAITIVKGSGTAFCGICRTPGGEKLKFHKAVPAGIEDRKVSASSSWLVCANSERKE